MPEMSERRVYEPKQFGRIRTALAAAKNHRRYDDFDLAISELEQAVEDSLSFMEEWWEMHYKAHGQLTAVLQRLEALEQKEINRHVDSV